MGKIGRNAPCPCGSGKKFKRCHGKDGATTFFLSEQIKDVLGVQQAKEATRIKQQGLGRPIVSTEFQGHRFVAVKDKLHYSKKWKFFTDFLADYIRLTLGGDWGNAELKKPFEDRHPLMQWYDGYCRYQEQTIKTPGEVHSADIIGVVACYLGVAYALYLLDHNAALQTRLINRLKNPSNFQGAYYELIVASILIRAGFTLTLEDETDPAAKHCEFAAVSKTTGKRYWVEAKMRAIDGVLGDRQSATRSSNSVAPISVVNVSFRSSSA